MGARRPGGGGIGLPEDERGGPGGGGIGRPERLVGGRAALRAGSSEIASAATCSAGAGGAVTCACAALAGGAGWGVADGCAAGACAAGATGGGVAAGAGTGRVGIGGRTGATGGGGILVPGAVTGGRAAGETSDAGRLLTRGEPPARPGAGLVCARPASDAPSDGRSALCGSCVRLGAAAFGSGSSGATSRRRPSASAFRRTRSACASSIEDE
jgi:hypothetical protein